MKYLFPKRWFWFFLGLFCLPSFRLLLGLFGPPTPKDAMSFTAVFEESRTDFFPPTDYSDSLRSMGSMEEFQQFVRKMKMQAFRVTDTRYEKKTPDAQHFVEIYYEGGWVTNKKWES